MRSTVDRGFALGALIFALLTAVGPAARASVVGDNPAGWALTFSDEFSGTALDSTKWSYRQLGPRRDAMNVANAVSVGDGLLNIATYTDAGVHYTGMIGTEGKFEQAFGYFEARMKFHSTPGQWSAFWLQSPTYGAVGDPATAGTEIDIVEHRATNRNDVDFRHRYVSAVHWDGYGAEHQQVSSVHQGLTGLGNDSWHTYGLKWSPSGYEFYFDDQLIWNVAQSISLRPEYLILSSEVEDGAWAGTVPAGGYGSLATSITNVQVDYVRVYAAVPPGDPSADFDADGDVDGADFLTWQRGVGTSAGAVRSDGNANAGHDGNVDAADLAVWRDQFGANSTAAPAGAAIPEPATWALAAWLSALVIWRRRSLQMLSGGPARAVLSVLVIGSLEAWPDGAVAEVPAGWELAFSDEFSGESLDESKWSYRQLGPRHDGVNAAAAVSVGDGLLTIDTYTEGGKHYTGMISTQDKFEQAYGYFEARMKFNSQPGNWSAFWLQSPAYGSVLGDPAAAGAEIDIVEHRASNKNGADIRKRYSSAVHWDGYGDAHQQVAQVHKKLRRMGNGSWHAYGLKWTPAGYEFYFDDKLVWKTDKAVSHRPEYVILSSEVRNGAWAGSIPAEGYGEREKSDAKVEVDYVRVYHAAPGAAARQNRDRDDR